MWEDGPVVLLIDDSPVERELLGRWLVEAGYRVQTCPGPRAPELSCIGGRSMRCPLAANAHVVVLDLRLASDVAMRGTPAWHLLVTYVAMGKQVVALTGQDDAVRPREDEQVTTLPRPPARDELLAAVRTSIERAEVPI